MIELNKKGVRVQERLVTLILKKVLTKFDPNFVDWRNPSGEIIAAMAFDHKGDIFLNCRSCKTIITNDYRSKFDTRYCADCL